MSKVTRPRWQLGERAMFNSARFNLKTLTYAAKPLKTAPMVRCLTLVRQCEIFTRGRKADTKITFYSSQPGTPRDTDTSDMASLAVVLRELKSLWSDFGIMLDNLTPV